VNEIRFYGADSVSALKLDLLQVYSDAYGYRMADPFYATERYWQRVLDYAGCLGFSLASCWSGDRLVGYTFGITLPVGAYWWRGLVGNVEDDLLVEDGRRTFALCEIAVLGEERRKGLGRKLHDALLSNRVESRFTLLVRPDNLSAIAAYTTWGWRRFAELRPRPDSPTFVSMMLDR
jgi:ribosomal protein S18 acetylase RimI-like enzyme